jgi:hypothetical protein
MSVANTGPDRSTWTHDDETRLIQFLIEHPTAAGGANFNASTWNAAAEELSKHVTKGAVKTATSCKGKWDRVCDNHRLHICTNYVR